MKGIEEDWEGLKAIQSELKRIVRLTNLPRIYSESASNKTQNSNKVDGKVLKGIKKEWKVLKNLPRIYSESSSNKTQNSNKVDGKVLKGIKKEWKVLKRIERDWKKLNPS